VDEPPGRRGATECVESDPDPCCRSGEEVSITCAKPLVRQQGLGERCGPTHHPVSIPALAVQGGRWHIPGGTLLHESLRRHCPSEYMTDAKLSRFKPMPSERRPKWKRRFRLHFPSLISAHPMPGSGQKNLLEAI
jgi:hypothetical protein